MGLRHRSGGGYKVQVLILGNPCLAACIINSPMGLGRTANCKLISEQLKDISKHLSKQADGKVQVAATIAWVCRNHLAADLNQELLTAYTHKERGRDAFWGEQNHAHCSSCFRISTASAMTLCSTLGCHQRVHQDCRPSSGVNWRCNHHQALFDLNPLMEMNRQFVTMWLNDLLPNMKQAKLSDDEILRRRSQSMGEACPAD